MMKQFATCLRPRKVNDVIFSLNKVSPTPLSLPPLKIRNMFLSCYTSLKINIFCCGYQILVLGTCCLSQCVVNCCDISIVVYWQILQLEHIFKFIPSCISRTFRLFSHHSCILCICRNNKKACVNVYRNS